MTRRFITFVACLGVVVVLAGCATPAVVPVAEPTPSVTPTPAAAIDPTVVPANRFGLDCDSLVSASTISALFDQALPLGPGNASLNSWRDALVADTALVCRWGEGPYSDWYGTSIDIIAGSSGSESLDTLATLDRPEIHRPTRVGGIGESAWNSCSEASDDVSGGRFSCDWTVEVNGAWISILLNGIPASEVDLGPNRDELGRLVVSSRPGSSSEQLVSEVASKIGTAEVQAIPAALGVMPDCESLFDWEAISAEINLPFEKVEGFGEDPSNPLLRSAVIGEISSTALTRQSVRHCNAEYWSADQRTYVWLSVSAVPGAQWLEASGLWQGWGEQACDGGEGGPLCELSTITETAAVNISASSHYRDDIAALALAHFNG